MLKEIVVGIPREIMPHEGRIPIFPASIEKLTNECAGVCTVRFAIQRGLGASLGITDTMWKQAGAHVCDKRTVYRCANIVVKVKQPFLQEASFYRCGQMLACFHHMATNREVIRILLKKDVIIAPFEYYRPSLAAMSFEAGMQVRTILDRLCGDSWKQEDIFFGGGRGMVCQTAIAQCRRMGIPAKRIHAFDINGGLFFSEKLRMSYWTFSSQDETDLCERLQKCRVLVLAAMASEGAPRFLKPVHLDLLPDGAVIVQVSIDEGGNIDDPEFQRVTYWGDPSYEVRHGSKRFTVCNVPDIPGCLAPQSASVALDQANFWYYCHIISSFPELAPGFRYLHCG